MQLLRCCRRSLGRRLDLAMQTMPSASGALQALIDGSVTEGKMSDGMRVVIAGGMTAETGGAAEAESTALRGQQLQQIDAGKLIGCVKAGRRGGMPAEAGMSLPLATAAIGTDLAATGGIGLEMGGTDLGTGTTGLIETEVAGEMPGMEAEKTGRRTDPETEITGAGQRATDMVQTGTSQATEQSARKRRVTERLMLMLTNSLSRLQMDRKQQTQLVQAQL